MEARATFGLLVISLLNVAAMKFTAGRSEIQLVVTAGCKGLGKTLLTYNARAAVYEAKCEIDPTNSVSWQPVGGTIRLSQIDDGPVYIGVRLTGFNTSLNQVTRKHGFHIHESKNLNDSCTKVGGHYNPGNQDHGAPTDTVRHAGDLGNVVEEGGEVNVVLQDTVITLSDMAGRHNVMGRSMVVHANEDDLGLGGETDSLTTGHAGTKIGCCVIEETTDYLYASCSMVAGGDANQPISGDVQVVQLKTGGMTTYQLNLTGFSSSDQYDTHGFHVHAEGSTDNGCLAAKGHYNPMNVDHGAPYNSLSKRHVGDLGNVNETTNGMITEIVYDVGSGLVGALSILDKAIVIHQKEDDLGVKDTDASRTTGDAGGRLGCCIIRAPSENLTAGANTLMWSVLHLVFGTVITLVISRTG